MTPAQTARVRVCPGYTSSCVSGTRRHGAGHLVGAAQVPPPVSLMLRTRPSWFKQAACSQRKAPSPQKADGVRALPPSTPTHPLPCPGHRAGGPGPKGVSDGEHRRAASHVPSPPPAWGS